MKRLVVNIILFFVAILAISTAGVFGLFYGLYYSLKNYAKAQFITYWADLFYLLNVGLDQVGNVMLAPFLNQFCLINKSYPRFGRVTETISYVLALNYITYNLTPFGEWIVNILERIDPGHMYKSLNISP